MTRKKMDSDYLQGLLEEYHRNGDPRVRTQLAEGYCLLATISARRLIREFNIPTELDVDDLTNAGVVGLLEAIDTFQPGRGARFKTFCLLKIRGAIIDEMRSFETFLRVRKAQSGKNGNGTHESAAPTTNPPAATTVAERRPPAQASCHHQAPQATERRNPWRGMISLSQATSFTPDDGTEFYWAEHLEDKRVGDPVQELSQKEIREVVSRLCSDLERLILVLYYYEHLSLKEIGCILEITESRVCQIHKQLLGKLKARLEARREELFSIAH